MTVTPVGGEAQEHRVWLANTEALRDRGLMDVAAVPGSDADMVGMAFVFDESTDVNFYMLHTRISLTIAFVSAGRVIDVVDMAPCPNDDDNPRCPRYGASAPYDLAIEVAQGQAPALGVAVGSLVSVS
jgi:uncharacterized membrane protein (UPF0127 family)